MLHANHLTLLFSSFRGVPSCLAFQHRMSGMLSEDLNFCCKYSTSIEVTATRFVLHSALSDVVLTRAPNTTKHDVEPGFNIQYFAFTHLQLGTEHPLETCPETYKMLCFQQSCVWYGLSMKKFNCLVPCGVFWPLVVLWSCLLPVLSILCTRTHMHVSVGDAIHIPAVGFTLLHVCTDGGNATRNAWMHTWM